MDDDRKMAVLVNDLDSMVHRIESLHAHTYLTDALSAVQKAKESVVMARMDGHQAALAKRHIS